MPKTVGNSELLTVVASDPNLTIVAPSDAVTEAGAVGGQEATPDSVNTWWKTLGEKVNHVLKNGIANWNNSTAYSIGNTVSHSGDIWIAIANNTNSTPVLGNSNWTKVKTAKEDTVTASAADMPTLANNSSDASHDIDITPGFCFDLTTEEKITLASAMTKRLDATFAESTGNGGFASGESLPTSGTVHVWLISKANGTADVFANNHATSGLSPTLPSGFVNKRRIASLITNASANIVGFEQRGRTFTFKAAQNDVNYPTNSPTTRTLLNLSVPAGIPVKSKVAVFSTQAVGYGYIASTSFADVAPDANNSNFEGNGGGGERFSDELDVLTTNGQVAVRFSLVSSYGINTLGYTDFIGAN